MPVYFIRSGDTGPVKIGWADDVEKRRKQLQTSHPYPLYVLRIVEGARGSERWLQLHYKAVQLLGEWFVFSDDMLVIEPPDLGPVPPKRPKKEPLMAPLPNKMCWLGNPCEECRALAANGRKMVCEWGPLRIRKPSQAAE